MPAVSTSRPGNIDEFFAAAVGNDAKRRRKQRREEGKQCWRRGREEPQCPIKNRGAPWRAAILPNDGLAVRATDRRGDGARRRFCDVRGA